MAFLVLLPASTGIKTCTAIAFALCCASFVVKDHLTQVVYPLLDVRSRGFIHSFPSACLLIFAILSHVNALILSFIALETAFERMSLLDHFLTFDALNHTRRV